MDLAAISGACVKGDAATLRQILSDPGLEPSKLDELDQKSGWTPLLRAAICGHANVVRCLLEFGVSPNKKSAAGETPLHIAVESGYIVIAKELLEFNADPNLTNEYGETPLAIATTRGDQDTFALLVRFGAVCTTKRSRPSLQHRPHPPLFPRSDAIAEVKSPGCSLPPRHSAASKSPSIVSSRRSTAISPFRSRSNSGERTALSQIADMQGLNNGILAALSTYDTEKTVPSESTLKGREKENAVARKLSYSAEARELQQWLTGLRLSHLTDRLLSSGHCSLRQLIASHASLTLESLDAIGIALPGEAMVLLAALELEAKYSGATNTCFYSCCTTYIPPQTLMSETSLYDWLNSLHLEEEFDNFYYAGFKILEPLLAIMHTRFALSDDTLYSLIKIQKLGHRHRILSQLVSDAQEVDPYSLLLGVSGLKAVQQRGRGCVVM